MVIRIWHLCFVLSCVFMPCLYAKTFSLNEAIAAEEKENNLQTTATSKLEPETSENSPLRKIFRNLKKIKLFKPTERSERFSFNKALRTAAEKSKKLRTTENIFPRGKKISSLQNRKTFYIKSPLKPNKNKNPEKARYRRRNQFIKRETDKNDNINKKYIPILRSLSLLFGNILSKSGESFEVGRTKLRKYRHSTKNKNKQCTCTDNSDTDSEGAESGKKTTLATTALVKVPRTVEPTSTEASTATTNYASNSDVSDLGQNTDLPTILSRDPTGTRRDHNGDGKGSSPTFHTSVEGDITRNNRDSERYTGSRKRKADTKVYEEDPDSTTREHASSTEFRRGVRRPKLLRPIYRGRIDKTSSEREDSSDFRKDRRHFDEFQGQTNSKRKNGVRKFGGDFNEPTRENKHEVGGDKTESPKFVQQFVRGDRRFKSKGINEDYAKSEEGQEEIINRIPEYVAGNQRLTDRNGTTAAEDQKTSRENAKLTSKDTEFEKGPRKNRPKIKHPVYSSGFVSINFDSVEVEDTSDFKQDRRNLEFERQRNLEFERQSNFKSQDSILSVEGNLNETTRQNVHKAEEEDLKRLKFAGQFDRGTSRFKFKNKFEEDYKVSVDNITKYIGSDPRLTGRNGTTATEDQKTSRKNATFTSKDTELKKGPRRDQPKIRHQIYSGGFDSTNLDSTENTSDFTEDKRNLKKFERQSNLKRKHGFQNVEGELIEPTRENKNKVESPKSVEQFDRGAKKFEPISKVNGYAKFEEDHYDSVDHIPYYISGEQRLSKRRGATTLEDQKTRENQNTNRENPKQIPVETEYRNEVPSLQHPVYIRGFDKTSSLGKKYASDIIEDIKNFDVSKGPTYSNSQDGFRSLEKDFNKAASVTKHETEGDENESLNSLQKFVRGDRAFESENSINGYAKFEEDQDKEGVVRIPHNSAGNQRVSDENGLNTLEDQKTNGQNPTLVSMDDLNNPAVMLQKTPKHKAPFVTIIDGYSVARDKNGANKLAEQSIRFHA